MIDDWLDLLSWHDPQDIDRACKTYLRDQPRRRPTPGDINTRASTYREARMKEARRYLPPSEPERGPKVTAEAAQRIMDEAGFTPDLSRALKRFPRAKTAGEAYERAQEPPEKRMTYETDPERLKRARAAAREKGAV